MSLSNNIKRYQIKSIARFNHKFSSQHASRAATDNNSFSAFNKLIFLLLCTLILHGCDLNYTYKHKVTLNIEQAFVTKDNIDKDQKIFFDYINDLTFNDFNTDQIIAFKKQEHDLLLKISVLNAPVDVSEFTLSMFPKYLRHVTYFSYTEQQGFSDVIQQHRSHNDEQRFFSNQRYAFNIDRENINKTHYLLVQSASNRYIKVEMADTNSYIKADSNFNNFFTLVYGIILAMILFNAVFYLFTRDTTYLLYSLYMASALYSLLWQEGKISEVPWLAWHIMGNFSGLIFFIISDAVAILFFYRFLRLSFRHSWLVKLVVMCVLFRVALMLTALVQFHLLDNLDYDLMSGLFNLSAIVSTLLVWVIMLIKTLQGFPQAKYLFVAWTLLIFTVFLRLIFAFNPHPDLIWMPHSYELGIMIEGLILAFAMANRTMEFRKQRDQAVSKYTAAERSLEEHQLIIQFQHDMQSLVKDPTLSADEVIEKVNIKFHLLINKAYPIKNSMIHINDELKGICTTGLGPLDIDLMSFKLNNIFTSNARNQTSQFEITTSNNNVMSFLYLPLNSNEFEHTRFIFGLKNNQPINSELMTKFRSYCLAAYAALRQAREVHQVALAANLDSMTKAHNRGSIEKIIKESLKNASRTTLAFIDLDNLKAINDQFGHATGDQCIIEVVELLNTHIQDKAKVGRIGGDEFIAVFSDVEFDSCEDILEHFMTALIDKQFTEQKLHITTSIGLAESRINETKNSLLEKADVALYHSKAQGKNQITVYSIELQS